MYLNKETEEQLKKLKQFTGITPNVSSRIAFYRSIESNFRYSAETAKKLDGSLSLSKTIWLGDTQLVTELTLKLTYPDLDEKGKMAAWAAHVEDGSASLRNHKNLISLSSAI